MVGGKVGEIFIGGRKRYQGGVLSESCLLRTIKLIFTKEVSIKPEKMGPLLVMLLVCC